MRQEEVTGCGGRDDGVYTDDGTDVHCVGVDLLIPTLRGRGARTNYCTVPSTSPAGSALASRKSVETFPPQGE